MSKNNCNPCKDSVFKTISSNPDFADLLEYIEQNGGDNVDVISKGEPIFVTESMVGNVKTFEVEYRPYTPLSINSFSDNIGLQVKGATVDDITFSWSFNKPVEFQSINRGVGAPTPTTATSYSRSVTNQGVTVDTSYTLSADDRLDDNRGSKTRSTSILFGNYIYRTVITIANRDNITSTTISGLDLPNLTKNLARSRSLTFTAQSTSNSYDIVLMPTSFGLTSGTQFKDTSTNFTGGWGKLFDIDLTNEEGFTESYGVWVASNKNLNGLTFQIS